MGLVTEIFYVCTKDLTIALKVTNDRLDGIELLPANTKIKQAHNSAPAWVQKLQNEILGYFQGSIARFSEDYPLTHKFSPFYSKVFEQLQKTLPGETLTYKELAERCDSPRASRAVGGAMSRNPYPLLVPCHRVTPAHAKGIGEFSAGEGTITKAFLLNLEKNNFASRQ